MTFSLDFFTKPYLQYSSIQILLESIASISGVASVVFAIRKNILVYPIGIVSTAIYTYLLYNWVLYGDMLINGYYTIMSIYGWWCWKQSDIITDNSNKLIENSSKNNSILSIRLSILFLLCFTLVILIYLWKFGSISTIPFINYIDSLYTSIFLLAMYLMALKRIENWYFWFIGNALAIPVFFIKGYGITGIQYILFLGLSIWGMIEWKKSSSNI